MHGQERGRSGVEAERPQQWPDEAPDDASGNILGHRAQHVWEKLAGVGVGQRHAVRMGGGDGSGLQEP